MSAVGRWRRLHVNDWHDRAFRALNAEARVVRLYVSAGPQTTSVGCFRLSTAIAVEDLGGTAEAFEEHLDAVCEAFGWAWDPLARVVWIANWFEQNPPANPNVVQSWAKLLLNVPDCDVKIRAIADIDRRLKDLPASFRAPWRELSKIFPVGESRTETIQGAGSREQRSGNQRVGSLAENGNTRCEFTQSPQLVRIAKETLNFTNHNRPIEELVDAFLETKRQLGHSGECTSAEAVAALTSVLADRRRDA